MTETREEGGSPPQGAGGAGKGTPGTGESAPNAKGGARSQAASVTSGTGRNGKADLDRRYDEKVLSLAKGSLAVVAVLGLLGAGLYVWSGWGGDGEAAAEVFEFVKVGLLPLAVMILTYYFAKQRRAGRGEDAAGGSDDSGA